MISFNIRKMKESKEADSNTQITLTGCPTKLNSYASPLKTETTPHHHQLGTSTAKSSHTVKSNNNLFKDKKKHKSVTKAMDYKQNHKS